ncbi:esterase, PHB depolymerase family [Rhizobium leguminosarum bv. trifolii WSM2297]|uniref:Esterase, PHB depolymerase family n=1 Tax=Rhizobium leguminosarum bv. trifolii WSM2297 TaxID=754762 RepID=J0CT24_RHILT|nr:PHB depolymerase family esterase [Rhizobium leguminosarum]EJC82965.1 esterase, PHB depolymerase family [Rhizobium leguminosarum bv. trifolii WSM2297]
MSFRFPKTLSQIVKAQRKYRRIVEKALRQTPIKTRPRNTQRAAPKAALNEVKGFGSNPGRLEMKLFAPETTAEKPPLVVVLHGCRQTPESLDAASGFSTLARQRGFILLYPEQTKANNTQQCFNWFRPSAVARDRGELMSIRQMIGHASTRYKVDQSRVYIAGLSAGGAMVSALVATYPDLFAGAAIVAGMPFGAARDAMSGLRAMRSGKSLTADDWAELVRNVSPGQKVWPPISIWHGDEDRVVTFKNAEALVSQWLAVSQANVGHSSAAVKAWGTLAKWKPRDSGQISLYALKAFGHGLPVRRPSVKTSKARSDPYVLDATVSAPLELMRLWGLKMR